MVRNLDICLEQFELFYTCLMKDAPLDFIPWFFPCEKNSKNPSPNAILKRDPTSKGSWHHTSARLNKQECIEHIKQGYNIGISARNEDILIIGDIDEVNYINQTPNNTLTNTSRKRDGRHFFGWNKDNTAKINLPTGKGEMRSQNQYVLSPGSYVEIDEKNYNQLTTEAQQDPLLGYYTILNPTTPRPLSFDDLPQFFKDKYQENKQAEIETTRRIEENKEPTKREGKYTELFELSVSDIVGHIKANRRVGHPLHSSDTDANFSLSKDGKLGHCWRHLVSLNAVQFLCVESGYSQCEDAGTPHKGGTSKIKGDKKALDVAYQQAIKDGYIKEKVNNKSPKGFSGTGLKLDNYIDNVETFYQSIPFFYDKSCFFWLWNKETYCYEKTDEIDLMNMIEYELGLGGQTVNNKVKGCYLEAFKRVGRLNIPQEADKHWIQFKNQIINIKTNEQFKATPKYFITNPIPYSIGNSEETPTIDKLFTDWQGDNKEILYQIISYCLLTDYPIHLIFAMVGSGSNGKSQYLGLLEHFVGINNITSASLDRITEERFESAKLYKKLICMMGETNFNNLNKTEQLKKLCSGKDAIDFEFKNKNPFTAHNYAKIIINTNSLPNSGDTTDGYYRRWLIIKWLNVFEESSVDVIDSIPEWEFNNLALKSIRILKELLEKGKFSNQGSIEQRKASYIQASNPLASFLATRCIQGDSFYVKAKDLYFEYINYLQQIKHRIIKRKEFNQLLAEEGFSAEHTKKPIDGDWVNSYWVDGLKLIPQNSLISPISPSIPTTSPPREKLSENHREKREMGKSQNNDLLITWSDVELFLLERPAKEIEINTLISYGVSENQLEQWKSEGLIFESRNGFVRLL